MSNFQNFLVERVTIEACKLMPKTAVLDFYGRDREDYRGILALHAMEKLKDAPVAKTADKLAWVTTVVRNRANDCRRQQKTVGNILTRIPDLPITQEISSPVNLEKQIIERDLLRRLRDSLAASDWSLLLAYLENGTVRATWVAAGQTVTERAFGRRLNKIICACRKKIQKITK